MTTQHWNLIPAEDGQLHTEECVENGWWLLDWDTDCRYVGVPEGGPAAAVAERILFVGAIGALAATAVVLARRRRR